MKHKQKVNRKKAFPIATVKRKPLISKMFVTSTISEINRPPSYINLFHKQASWLYEINEEFEELFQDHHYLVFCYSPLLFSAQKLLVK